MILSQFEEAVWHRRGSDCDIAEAWHHGGEIVSAVEAVLEFGEVAGYMLAADGAISTSDGAGSSQCPPSIAVAPGTGWRSL